jgi:uncharacterized membrane protein (DUF4010 family)
MADESEVSDAEADAALDRIRAAFSERSRLIARKTRKSGCVFAISIAAATMFLKGMPLHSLFYPFGQILLVVCVLTFAVAGFDVAVLVCDWFDRRKLDRTR